jgi:hypothetical protein
LENGNYFLSMKLLLVPIVLGRESRHGRRFVKGIFESIIDAKGVYVPPSDEASMAFAEYVANRIKLTKHVYEFGYLFKEYCEEYKDLAFQKLDNPNAGVHIPYDEVCFTYALESMDILLYVATDVYVDFIKEMFNPTGVKICLVLGRAFRTRGKNEKWYLSASVVDWHSQKDKFYIVRLGNIKEEDDEITLLEFLCANEMIMTKSVVCEDGFTARRRNTTRKLLGKKPLTSDLHVITHINKVQVVHRGESTATPGIPKSPHDRRGHFRRLKNGKMIPVRGSAIHGGTTRRVIHEVQE